MSEEKLKIFEIIREYTNKTLSEGCLIGRGKRLFRYLYRLPDKDFHRFMVHEYNGDIKLARFQKGKLSIEAVFGAGIEEEILGHYDITAVLKCIYKKLWSKNKETILNRNGLLIILGEEEDIFIPLKPLHLYTKEEDLKLLEILGTNTQTKKY